MSTERKHHKFSPSKLQSLEACPGYESENTTSLASAAGTLQHDAADSGDFSKLDDEQMEKVQMCIDFVDEQVARLGPGAILIREEYLPIDEAETTAGYLDVGAVSADGKKAIVIDFKYGLNPVEDAKNNLQGMAYLLGIYRRYPTIEEADVFFLMPYQHNISHAPFTKAEFADMYLRICTIVARAKKATAAFETNAPALEELKPTNGTCVFCARKADCPALHKLVLKAGKKYDPLVVPDVINPLLISSPVDAAKALKFFDVMAALAKSYRSKATEKAMNEENWVPEGYGLTSVSRRSIVNKGAFFETIKGLLTPEQVTECIDFTLGPVEKIVSESAPRGKKKEAVEDLKNLLAMNGATEEGAPIAVLRQKKGSADS